MIRREKGHYVVICDGCEEKLDDEYDTFDEARAAAKSAGWAVQRDIETTAWLNACPECK